jgi:hypothetical protein
MVKFILKVFMSIILDKDARKKLDDRSQLTKKMISKKSVPVIKDAAHKVRSADLLADDGQAIIEVLAEAREMLTAPEGSREPAKLEQKLSKRRSGAHKALDQALGALPEQKKAMTPERRALIKGAIALTKMKTAVLDDLAPEQRKRLQAMAIATFSGKVAPPKGRK